METNLKYINQICVDLGGTGGHILNVRGENEICMLLGGTGGHSLEINALNEICTIQGVTAGHSLVLNALNAIAGVTKVTNLEAWKYIQSGSVLNQTQYTDSQIQALIDDGYIPIATKTDLAAIATTYSGETTREFAAGTKWATGLINTLGLASSYVQVNDINVGVTSEIVGVFTGIYNGGNYSLHDISITRYDAAYIGIFSKSTGATFRNILVKRSHIIAGPSIGTLVGWPISTTIDNVAVVNSSIIGTGYAGGVIGRAGIGSNNVLSNIFADCTVKAPYVPGGIAGLFESSTIENAISVGFVFTEGIYQFGGMFGSIVEKGTTITNCYFNHETLGLLTANGEPKTTTELTNLSTGFDASKWGFKAGKYPYLKQLGEIAANIQPPKNITITPSGGNSVISWDACADSKGYNVYVSKDGGIWTKINASLVTDLSYNYTPTGATIYDYIVKSVFDINGEDQETGNSTKSIPYKSFSNGKLNLAFDDGYATWRTVGLPVFQAHNVKGTFYFTRNKIGTAGFCTWAQVQEMHAGGMDCQCHGDTHTSFSELTDAQLRAEMESVNAAFIANSLPAPTHGAYPNGAYIPGTTARVLSPYRKSEIRALNSVQSLLYYPPNVNKYEIPRIGIDYMTADDLAKVLKYLEYVQAQKWAISLYAHEIVATDPTIRGVLVAQLNAIINKAKELGMDIECMTELYPSLDAWNEFDTVGTEAASDITFIYNGVPTNFGIVTGANGTKWLDRNLGASRVAASFDDTLSYGDMYQWGRKKDGHENRNSALTELNATSSTDVVGHGNFIRTNIDPNDWRNPQNDSLWKSRLNVPAPIGWRIPTITELNNERLAFASNDRAGAFGSVLKIPANGYRNNNGTIYNTGVYSYIWSSDVDNIAPTNCKNLYVTETAAWITTTRNRAWGMAVRLIKGT